MKYDSKSISSNDFLEAEKKAGMDNREFTRDTFFNGKVVVRQFKSGYRFSIDAVILSYYASSALLELDDTVLDLGTGCGIIPMLMAYRSSATRFMGIEIQEALARIAGENIQENEMSHRIQIKCEDIKKLKAHHLNGPFKMIVSNPPYRKAASGRINPDEQRAIARHEIKLTLKEMVQSASRLLETSGKLMLIYPAERLASLIVTLREFKLEPKMLRFIHSKPSTNAKLILMEAVKVGRPGIKISAPLYIYEENGDYTPSIEKMFIP